MLPTKKRIGKMFLGEVSKKGKTFNSSFFLLKTLKSDSYKQTKVAFVVSKKVSSVATERNFLKRRGFVVVQRLYPFIKPSYLLLFTLKKNNSNMSFKEIFDEIEKLLKSANVLV